MACSGCQKRQEALRRMQEQARQKNLQGVVRMGSYIVRSGVRDLRGVASQAALWRTQRRG